MSNAKRQGLSGGELTIDPTENVKALSAAANQRQDDLRAETNRRIDAELSHVKFVAELRASHAKDIRELESRRLDAIRQVDVTAVKTEADRALAAISVLATTTATNAENLRNALTNTAQTIAKQTSDTVSQITERIAALEKSSYEGAGKQAYADPMLAELVSQVKTLTSIGAGSVGRGEGAKNLWGIMVAVAVLLFGFVGMLIGVMTFILARR